MSEAPIIFLLGPSGVGKTSLGNALAQMLGMLHILFDGPSAGDGVDAAKLRVQWDTLLNAKDPHPLADEVRKRIKISGHSGAVISCPSGVVSAEDLQALSWHFSRSLLAKMKSCGVRCVTLFGPLQHCRDAAINRADGTGVTIVSWDQNNPDWKKFRPESFSDQVINVFKDDGRRRGIDDLVREFQERFLV